MPHTKINQAIRLLQSGERSRATEMAVDLAANSPASSLEFHADLAILLQRLEQHDLALTHFQKAVDLDPLNATLQYNLATEYRFLGNRPKAEFHLDQAIKTAPDDSSAWYLRSQLRRQTHDSNHVAGLRDLLIRLSGNPRAKSMAGFALAKELEDLGNYKESFVALEMANTLRRANMQYDADADLQVIQAIRDSFSTELLAQPSVGYESDEPVFVLGMPRTGSTLVERILGSHPDIFAAGELNNLAVEMMSLLQGHFQGKRPSKLDVVAGSTELDPEQLGAAYIRSTRPATGHTRLFIDKLPMNFLYVGLIARSLPDARIIHVRRNAMDTCYAIYKTLFEAAYPYSYDLGELARYYVAYRDLMEHWDNALPGRIYHVDYESLVRNTESEVRRLLDHCGVDWDSRCLRYFENPEVSTTASASQVREKMYDSSIGAWENYRSQLMPLSQILAGR